MWHGSHTFVGYSFDNNMIAVISYLAHQASVSGLSSKSTILKELSASPRNMTGVEVSTQLTNLFLQPAETWPEVLNSLDLPLDYYITFSALISTFVSLIAPWFVTELVMSTLADKILTPKDRDFLNNDYLPALHEAVKDVSIEKEEKTKITSIFVSMMIKLLYATFWQEHLIPLPKIQDSPFDIHIGDFLLPYVNDVADRISGIPQTDEAVKTSKNVYPGDSFCRGYQAHSIWHEESSTGLLELVFLADYINKVLTKHENSPRKGSFGEELSMFDI